jgi:hypothetical protein
MPSNLVWHAARRVLRRDADEDGDVLTEALADDVHEQAMAYWLTNLQLVDPL